jgi:predicted transcriptional regulator
MSERINPYNMFVGSFLPNWLLERTEISTLAKVVYARLAQFAGKDGRAFPTIETLANGVGVPKRNVDRALLELKKFKLIEVERRGLNKPNLYFFLSHKWFSVTPPAALPDTPPVAQQDMPSVAHRRESSKENHLREPGPPKRGALSARLSTESDSDKKNPSLSVKSLFDEQLPKLRAAR